MIRSGKMNLKRTQKREIYYREKVQKANEKVTTCQEKVADVDDQMQDILTEMKEMKEEILQLREENLSLRNSLQQTEDSAKIETYDHERNCFSDATTKCVYGLLEQHVSVARVSAVIDTVTTSLMKKRCTRLPSKTTVTNMNIQRLAVAQEQIAEEMASKEHTTLYSDETSKYGEKVMGYHLSDENKRFWVLGLRDITIKSAADTPSTFKTLLDDISTASTTATSDPGKSILLNISNTMSDRASTETKFHTMLESYREEVLPELHANWEEMTEEERQPLSSLSSFFCGLHSQ